MFACVGQPYQIPMYTAKRRLGYLSTTVYPPAVATSKSTDDESNQRTTLFIGDDFSLRPPVGIEQSQTAIAVALTKRRKLSYMVTNPRISFYRWCDRTRRTPACSRRSCRTPGWRRTASRLRESDMRLGQQQSKAAISMEKAGNGKRAGKACGGHEWGSRHNTASM